MITKKDLRSDSEVVADLLDAIPQWYDGPITISEWLNRAAMTKKDSPESVRLIISLLKTFDTVSILETCDATEARIKSQSELSSLFIKSLAIYLREERKILSNWERFGVTEGPFSINDLLSGPQFLYAMESQRTLNTKDAPVIRKTIITKAIIKACVRGFKEPVYLVQFDEKAKKYQLIGGHIRKTDDNAEISLKRELEEELHKANYVDGLKYKLCFLDKVTKNEISLSCGAFTEYELNYFQPLFAKKQITLGPNDRWITLHELINGRTKNGIGINETGILILNEKLPRGLSGLNLSLEQIQRRSLFSIAKDHPWETIGIILSLVGILLSIVFFLLGR